MSVLKAFWDWFLLNMDTIHFWVNLVLYLLAGTTIVLLSCKIIGSVINGSAFVWEDGRPCKRVHGKITPIGETPDNHTTNAK